MLTATPTASKSPRSTTIPGSVTQNSSIKFTPKLAAFRQY